MNTESLSQEVSKHAGWSIFMGILTTAVGAAMIIYPLATATASTVFFGAALVVAAVAQLAVELIDQVAPVGEDQHAAGARGLDEAEGRDRLAGAGRVLEPEPARGVGVLGLLGELDVVVDISLVLPVLGLLVRLALLEVLLLLARDGRGGQQLRLDRHGAVRPAVAVGIGIGAVAGALGFGQERGQRAREGIDLVRG